MSDLLSLLYAAEEEVQREQQQHSTKDENENISPAHDNTPLAVTLSSPVISSTSTAEEPSLSTTTLNDIFTTSTTTNQPATLSITVTTTTHSESNRHNLSTDIFSPQLGEGVTVLKNLPPDALEKKTSFLGDSSGSLPSISSESVNEQRLPDTQTHPRHRPPVTQTHPRHRPPVTQTPPGHTHKEESSLSVHQIGKPPLAAPSLTPTHSRSRPGVVLPVDKTGEPLAGSVPRVPPNNTYISPSKSMGRGGFPTIERVYQPGQVEPNTHTVTVQGVDSPNDTQDINITQQTTTQESDFDTKDVNAIDWYYNNYYREYASLPVGGNKPVSGASTLTLAPILTCLIGVIHNLVHL
ncbi:hypothetical protein OTU49_011288 [Cherax quadricarinatus]|uniref:Uncharacterized protein n=3 Tax=Cherax quadricarinatus TaxID=27406 RepID=A0AAW0W480_CHEQU